MLADGLVGLFLPALGIQSLWFGESSHQFWLVS